MTLTSMKVKLKTSAALPTQLATRVATRTREVQGLVLALLNQQPFGTLLLFGRKTPQ